jgi:hypothetical protein
MSIKSDKWIRRMAQQHGMIEPFESGQVRDSEQGRVISFYRPHALRGNASITALAVRIVTQSVIRGVPTQSMGTIQDLIFLTRYKRWRLTLLGLIAVMAKKK